jgi:hypothetical protein
MIWGVVSLILLIVIIALVIWLLVRSDNTAKFGQLNSPCNNDIDCHGGLVCSAGQGTNASTPSTSTTLTKTCQVASGGTCSVGTDCAVGYSCINGVCTRSLGSLNGPCPCGVGYTCVNNVCKAVLNHACSADSDCASGMCMNNVCVASSPVGPTGSYDCTSYYTSDCTSTGSYYTCTDSNCEGSVTRQSSEPYISDTSRSYDTYSSKRDTSYSYDTSSKSYDTSCDTSSKSYDTSCDYTSYSGHGYVKRGVYVTTEQNQDQTLFTGIDQPIIDIAKTDRIYLLLENGDVVMNSGMSNTVMHANKKMLRMVRFGTQIVGVDRKGKLYFGVRNNDGWTWEHLNNYPCDVTFINSTNTGNNMEVVTSRGKAHLYTFSMNWKDGNPTSVCKRHSLRFYGNDTSRYMDIDERSHKGITNDGVCIKKVKAGGFYNTGTLVPVLLEDSFTHNRVIDNKSYFLFEQ